MFFDTTSKGSLLLIGLAYGLGTYFAPFYAVGPNGILPLYMKELDPISTFYIRLHGNNVLFFILAYLFFLQCGGSPAQKRSYTKMVLAGHIAFLLSAPRIKAKDDFSEEYFSKQHWYMVCAFSFMMVLGLCSIIVLNPNVPTDDKVNSHGPLLRTLDKVGFTLLGFYVGYLAYQNCVNGPIQSYWNPNKLEYYHSHYHNHHDDTTKQFNLMMNESACTMGSSLFPLALYLFTDAWKLCPKYTWKLLCLYMILVQPIMYRQMYEMGYSIHKSFVGDYIADTFILLVGLYRLGVIFPSSLSQKLKKEEYDVVGAKKTTAPSTYESSSVQQRRR